MQLKFTKRSTFLAIALLILVGASSCTPQQPKPKEAASETACAAGFKNSDSITVVLPPPLPNEFVVGIVTPLNFEGQKIPAKVLGSWCIGLSANEIETLRTLGATGHITLKIAAPPQDTGLIQLYYEDTSVDRVAIIPNDIVKSPTEWAINTIAEVRPGIYTLAMISDIPAAVAEQTPVATNTADEAKVLSGKTSTIQVQAATKGSLWTLNEVTPTQLPKPHSGDIAAAILVGSKAPDSAVLSAKWQVPIRANTELGVWRLTELGHSGYVTLNTPLNVSIDTVNPNLLSISATPVPANKVLALIWEPLTDIKTVALSPSAAELTAMGATVSWPSKAYSSGVLGLNAATKIAPPSPSQTVLGSWLISGHDKGAPLAALSSGSMELTADLASGLDPNSAQVVFTTIDNVPTPLDPIDIFAIENHLRVKFSSRLDSGTYSLVINSVLTALKITDIAPTITDIADHSTNEDAATAAITFTIADVESTLDCNATYLSMSSSNTATVANTAVLWGGTYPNCTAVITPTANAFGTPTITITVSDLSASATDSFNLTVIGVNDVPTITDITNKSTNEDTATAAITFTIADSETTMSCNATYLNMTSSDTATVANTGVIWGGTYPNCTAVITPTANAFGTPTITITASDLTASTFDSFALTVTAVNDAPTITNITNKSTNKNNATSAIAFTIADVETPMACNTTHLSMSSSTTAIVANADVIWGGTYPICTAVITPVANALGAPTITISVSDGAASSSSGFVLTVNSPPTITDITDKSTSEDTATAAINVTINDPEGAIPCNATYLSMSSSDTAIVANASVVWGGTNTNCTAVITPVANKFGPTTITITASDGQASTTDTFVLTVTAVNDAPTITDITDKSTNEDTATSELAFTIADIDTTLVCNATYLSMSSSDTNLIPNGSIVFGGTFPNCTAALTPAANLSGTSTITITVSDLTLEASDAFVLTVIPVNDTPTITSITNKSTNEDTATAAIAFTIADIDTTMACNATFLSMSSSNTAAVDNASVVWGGTYPACTAVITPATNAVDTPTITIAVNDGALSASVSFDLTVNPVNDAPTITSITNKITNKNTATSAIAFTIADVDTTLACSAPSLSMISSDPAIVANADVLWGGTYPNCTAVITPVVNAIGAPTITIGVSDGSLSSSAGFALTVNSPPTITDITNISTNEDTATTAIAFTIADVDTTLVCNATHLSMSSSITAKVANTGVVWGGTYPNCTAVITPVANAFGIPTITITISDGTASASDSFDLTVTAVNDVPTITDITNKTINEDTATAAIAFTISEVETTTFCTATYLSMSSSNTATVANADVVWGGTYPNCTVAITPVANAFGTATITITVSDGTDSASDSFDLTVTAVNDVPTITDITNKSTDEDTATAAIAFTIADVESTLDCNATFLSMSSSNTATVANSGVVWGGTFPDCTAVITPVANAFGTPTITITVSDGTASAADSFGLTVTAVNDVPTITDISNKTTNEDTATTAITFTIADVETTMSCSATYLSMSSSSTATVANAGVVWDGTFPNCTAVITPVANAFGTPTITITVSDGTGSAADSFDLAVTAVNDVPTITAITNKTTNKNTATSAIAFTIADIETPMACNSSYLIMSSSNTAIVASADVVWGGTYPICTAVITPITNALGAPTITISVNDGTISSSSGFELTVNSLPTIADITDKSTIEDTATAAINVTINDAEGSLACTETYLGMSSSNTATVANAGVVWGGTYPNCTAVITPLANAFGTTTVTITVSDLTAAATDTFVLTVTAVNDVPTITGISDQITNTNTATTPIAFTIADVETTMACNATYLSMVSSSPTIVANASVVWGGTYPNCTAVITPVTDAFGTPTITVTVSDGALSSSAGFALTVNSPLAITHITNKTTNEDTATAAINVNITDPGATLSCNETYLSMSSSDAAIVANTGVAWNGSYPNCTAVITPIANAFGTTTITITVNNGTYSSSDNFVLTVTAVNDAPTVTDITDKSTNPNTATSAIAFTIADLETTMACNATYLSMTSSNTTTVVNSSVVWGGTYPNCTAVITPVANACGLPTITVSVSDGSASTTDTFVLTVNCLSATGSLVTARDLHVATLLPNGKVLSTGGYDGSSYLASAELYDPQAGTFGATGALASGRGYHTQTLLPTGKVLIAGGYNGSSYLASAELYNPATGTSSATGALATVRGYHSQTLLPNGKVLITGGYNGSSLASSELYNPQTSTFSATGALIAGRYYHSQTLLPNGKVLITGGYNGSSYLASAELYDPQTGTFSATGALAAQRSYHSQTLLPNGKVLITGGYNGTSYLASAELYDPQTGTFSATGALATERGYHSQTLLPNGKVLSIGGYNGSVIASAELYDPQAGTYSAAGTLATGRRYHTQTLLPNGKVLIAGGHNGTSYLASAELYTMSARSQSFAASGALAAGRYYHTQTLLPNGKVLVVGGFNGAAMGSPERYDPQAGTFSVAGTLTTTRRNHTATLLTNGKVLLIGGWSEGAPLTSSELYDPAADTFSAAGELEFARYYHTQTLLPNGKVLIVGGYDGSPLANSELYDPQTDTFSATGSLIAGRYNHSQTLLPNGKVLITGGYNGSTYLASAELYDPGTGTFSATGTLAAGRHYHTQTLLPNGKVLITGGADDILPLTSAELFDPQTGTFSATGELAVARSLHNAILLPNGKVLITGGYDGTSYLASAELYDPQTGTFSATGALIITRRNHTATLLPNGKVLIIGGYNSSILSSSELYLVYW